MTDTRGIRSKRTSGQKNHAAIKRGSHAGRVPASTGSSVSQCLRQGCWSFCLGVLSSPLYPFMTLVAPKFYFLKKKRVCAQSEHLDPYKGPPSFALRSFPDKPTPAHKGLLGAGTSFSRLGPGNVLAACSLLRAGTATWAGAL